LKYIVRLFLYVLICFLVSVPYEPQRHYRAMTGKEISKMRKTDILLEQIYDMYYKRKFTLNSENICKKKIN